MGFRKSVLFLSLEVVNAVCFSLAFWNAMFVVVVVF